MKIKKTVTVNDLDNTTNKKQPHSALVFQTEQHLAVTHSGNISDD